MPEKTWRLKRTKQCAKCPWKKSTNPHDIPNGYTEELHAALRKTIAEPGRVYEHIHSMACHESPIGKEAFCVGWLHHQLGPGNNIPLRIKMLSCVNARAIAVKGAQHQSFEETLPASNGEAS